TGEQGLRILALGGPPGFGTVVPHLEPNGPVVRPPRFGRLCRSHRVFLAPVFGQARCSRRLRSGAEHLLSLEEWGYDPACARPRNGQGYDQKLSQRAELSADRARGTARRSEGV